MKVVLFLWCAFGAFSYIRFINVVDHGGSFKQHTVAILLSMLTGPILEVIKLVMFVRNLFQQ